MIHFYGRNHRQHFYFEEVDLRNNEAKQVKKTQAPNILRYPALVLIKNRMVGQNLPDLNMEYNSQINIIIATPKPISIAGKSHRIED